MKQLLAILVLVTLVGCAATSSLPADTNTQTSFDGLVKINNSDFKDAWLDPDTDISRYTKVMLVDTNFEFRAVKHASSSRFYTGSTNTEFSIDEKARQQLIAIVNEVFTEELAKSQHFALTDKAGPDVLIVRGKILDIVSNVPPEPFGRGDIYLRELGSAKLVLELADSLSGETLARASERSSIDTQNKTSDFRFATKSNAVTNWNDVTRWARRWASKFTRGLDSFY